MEFKEVSAWFHPLSGFGRVLLSEISAPSTEEARKLREQFRAELLAKGFEAELVVPVGSGKGEYSELEAMEQCREALRSQVKARKHVFDQLPEAPRFDEPALAFERFHPETYERKRELLYLEELRMPRIRRSA